MHLFSAYCQVLISLTSIFSLPCVICNVFRIQAEWHSWTHVGSTSTTILKEIDESHILCFIWYCKGKCLQPSLVLTHQKYPIYLPAKFYVIISCDQVYQIICLEPQSNSWSQHKTKTPVHQLLLYHVITSVTNTLLTCTQNVLYKIETFNP